MTGVASQLADLDQRSRDILQALVDSYLRSGRPVGSRLLSRDLQMHLSPSSIRDVMADLEESGLIFSPHTSAGRLPTEAGLRFFVDTLMERTSLSSAERDEIDARIDEMDQHDSVAGLLAQATGILSELSRCACVVVTPRTVMRLKHTEFVPLRSGQALMILVGEDGAVENRAIEIPADLPPFALKQLADYLNSRFSGRTLPEIEKAVGEQLEHIRNELDTLSAKVAMNGFASWSDQDEAPAKTLIVRGRAHLIDSAAMLADLDRLRQLFDDLEAKKDLIRLLESAQRGQGVKIFIGSENKLFSLSGSSLITMPLGSGDHEVIGAIGLIGPTRLNYARIVPMIDYTAKVIARLLS